MVQVVLLLTVPIYFAVRWAIDTTDSALPVEHAADAIAMFAGDFAGDAARFMGLTSDGLLHWLHGLAPVAVTLPITLLTLTLFAWAAARSRGAALGAATLLVFLLPPLVVRSTIATLNYPTWRQIYLPLLGFSFLVAALARGLRVKTSLAALCLCGGLAFSARTAFSAIEGRGLAVRAIRDGTQAALAGVPAQRPVAWVGIPTIRFSYSVTMDWPGRSEIFLVPRARSGFVTLCRSGSHTVVARAENGLRPLPRFPAAAARMTVACPASPSLRIRPLSSPKGSSA